MGGQPRWLDEIQQVVDPYSSAHASNGVYPQDVCGRAHIKADIAEEERLEREAGRAVLESVVGRERERHVENEP